MDRQMAALDKELDNMDEDDLEQLRERRKEEMKKRQKERSDWRQQGHGEYFEVTDQKAFFAEVKGSKRVVCHFYRPSNQQCNIVDKHLSICAKKHMETKFMKINAEKAPYLVEKLNIWMIPSIVLCVNGKTEHTITGFDELGGSNEFSTELFEYHIAQYNVIDGEGLEPPELETTSSKLHRIGGKGKIRQTALLDNDSDDDWD